MERSKLYDLLSIGILQKWRTHEEEKDDYYKKCEIEIMEELKQELNEKSKHLLTSYSLAIENRIDYLHYNLDIKILNFGIKIGMELEKAFNDWKEQ